MFQEGKIIKLETVRNDVVTILSYVWRREKKGM